MLSVHMSHLGPTGKQTTFKVFFVNIGAGRETRRRLTWPKPTRRWFISLWNSVGSHDCRLSLARIVSEQNDRGVAGFLSPSFFRGLRGRFMPFEPVGDTVHVDVYADTHISSRRVKKKTRGEERRGKRRTYPMRRVSTKTPFSGLRPGASTAHRRSSARPHRIHLAAAVPPAVCTYITKTVSTHQLEREKKVNQLTVFFDARSPPY